MPYTQIEAASHGQARVTAQVQGDDNEHTLPSPADDKKQPSKKSAALMNAFEKAAAYRRSSGKGNPSSTPADPPAGFGTEKPSPTPADSDDNETNQKRSGAVLLEELSPDFKAIKRKQELEMASALTEETEAQIASKASSDSSQGLEVEIITRDGIIKRKASRPGETFSKTKGLKRTGVNSSDFMGLDFSEKKFASKNAKPAGLAVGLEAPPPGSLPEVEIITRDGKAQQSNNDGLYKPKVATWGIFERPANISQTYGGGRTIKPGEQLETEEEKKAREARTKQLLAAYNKKIGLDVDPKIKADCLKALKQGNDSLEKGNVQHALTNFEKVMQQMPYQSELHGMAALQWAVCLDSSNRFQEAREMYEKIASHPNVTVRKKAKELLFGFQAMDVLKVSATAEWDSTAYRKYFDSFADGYNTLYKPNGEEAIDGSMVEQAFIYLGFLLFPLALFLLVIILKGR